MATVSKGLHVHLEVTWGRGLLELWNGESAVLRLLLTQHCCLQGRVAISHRGAGCVEGKGVASRGRTGCVISGLGLELLLDQAGVLLGG